jgi:hypothetical protein
MIFVIAKNYFVHISFLIDDVAVLTLVSLTIPPTTTFSYLGPAIGDDKK